MAGGAFFFVSCSALWNPSPSLSKMIFYHRIESPALLRADPVTLTQKIKQSQNQIKPARGGGAWRRVNGASARIQGRYRAPAPLAWLGCALETVGSVYAGDEPTRDCVLVTILAISTRRFGCLRKRLQSISFVASAMPFEGKLITFRGKTNAVHKMTDISGLSSCLHSFWG